MKTVIYRFLLGLSLLSALVLGVWLWREKTAHQAQHYGQLTVPFYGQHQAGITTPAQKSLYLVVLDLATDDKEEVIQTFKDWTSYSAQLIAGEGVEEESDNAYLPPKDTGETLDLNPYRLTLTYGISPSFLEKLGLAEQALDGFEDLPSFSGDQLDSDYTGGDIIIQAAADDDQVAFHAIRNLIRKARGTVTMKWSQSGFLPTGDEETTPRNLFGFRDGTANALDEQEQEEIIWSQDSWLSGGTFMVVRKIRMHLETWDRTSLAEQENTFGRYKDSGAPFGQTDEFDELDIEALDEDGEPVIPVDSHAALAKSSGMEMYRRSYSYADGINETTGQFEAGLLFISFQKHPEQFIKTQQALGSVDKLNEYITHIGSGLFAIFPGVEEGGYLGQDLFE